MIALKEDVSNINTQIVNTFLKCPLFSISKMSPFSLRGVVPGGLVFSRCLPLIGVMAALPFSRCRFSGILIQLSLTYSWRWRPANFIRIDLCRQVHIAKIRKNHYLLYTCRGGEIGRRARLKIWLGQPSVGSNPTLGTKLYCWFYLNLTICFNSILPAPESGCLFQQSYRYMTHGSFKK